VIERHSHPHHLEAGRDMCSALLRDELSSPEAISPASRSKVGISAAKLLQLAGCDPKLPARCAQLNAIFSRSSLSCQYYVAAPPHRAVAHSMVLVDSGVFMSFVRLFALGSGISCPILLGEPGADPFPSTASKVGTLCSGCLGWSTLGRDEK